MRELRIGLLAKFLLIVVPVFLVLSGMSFSLLSVYDTRGAVEALSARMGNDAARVSAALARHAAMGNPDLARDLLTPLETDEAVTCIQLGTGGSGANSESNRCRASVGEHTLSLPVGETNQVLTVWFTDAEIVARAAKRRHLVLLALAIAFAVAVLSAALAFRLAVGRRLRSLSLALGRIAKGGERLPLPQGGRDELGEIMSAFNDMVATEAKREDELKRSLQALHGSRTELACTNAELERRIHAGESEQRFRDFAASASDWYWEMDADLRFSFFSDRFSEVTGVPNDALLGKTREETGIPDVDPDTWARHLNDLRNHRSFRGFKHPRNKASGESVWLSINGTATFDSDGKFSGYRGTGADITERMLFEEELVRAKELSEQTGRAKSDFLAKMSHEIRTPMNGVLGLTELIQRCPLSDKAREYAAGIKSSATVMLALIDDILDFSKIEAGKVELEAVPTSVRELTRELRTLFGPEAAGRRLDLTVNVGFDVPDAVLTDPVRLRQILMNLIGNGLKFTEQGGIHLEVTGSAGDAHSEGGLLAFSVTDTGIGLTADASERIFDDFAQADGSTTRRFGGTGLGLAISKGLVELMGGELTVRSAPGQGSTFAFSIPTVRASKAEAEEADVLAPSTTSIGTPACDLRVLVAEDHPVNQLLAMEMLELLGAQATLVETGDAAALTVEHERFDVVLMDCQMPVMDGFEATRTIRQNERRRGEMEPIHIIALTANAIAGDRERCLRAGMDDYLSKPFTIDALSGVLRKAPRNRVLASAVGN